MSLLRCCCGAAPEVGPHACYPCPTPIAPYTAPQWYITATASGIEGEADGSGALATGGVVLGCQRGSCGSVTFKEKAVGNDTYAMAYCDPVDVCNAMHDTAAPANFGTSRMEWTTCKSPDGEDAGGPLYPDVAYTYNAHVRIVAAGAQTRFIPALTPPYSCTWVPATAEDTDCRSWIEVEYTFTNYFEYPFFEDAGPGQHCYQNVASISTTQTWICVYSKRPSPGQWIAEGQYPLVKISYPTAAHTNGPLGSPPCSLPGGTVCSPTGLTPVTAPTQWQPPTYITLVRVA